MSTWLAAREQAATKAEAAAYEERGNVEIDEPPADARRSHWLRPPPVAPRPVVPVAHAAPLAMANAVGRRVLVPAQLYPQYRCDERGGEGWEATVVRATSTTAVVHYVSARTADGRPYADDRLPLTRLQPI